MSSYFGLLTDDVTVYFFALGHGQTRVTIRARTRMEIGDLGRCARHIRQLQFAMDDPPQHRRAILGCYAPASLSRAWEAAYCTWGSALLDSPWSAVSTGAGFAADLS